MATMAENSSRIKAVFKEWDSSNNGIITSDLLSKLLQQLGDFELPEIETLLQSLDHSKTGRIAYIDFVDRLMGRERSLSLPKAVAGAGGIDAWNAGSTDIKLMSRNIEAMCKATSVEEALEEVQSIMSMGHNLWAYAYMRKLYNRNLDLYYAVLAAKPTFLLPVVYTPTVGEACQKFGKMPFYRRGCYLSITDRGRFKEVLAEYAEMELGRDAGGNYLCDCIVFSDGGRILGLGDLGAWGMGIPIGKLDLYTVCAGVNPHRTIPVIIDAGCHGADGNTDKVVVRDHPFYTGLKQPRVQHKSPAGTMVNSAYFGDGNIIGELLEASAELFGRNCLCQFEDFNSNDAFPLLAEYRDKFLTYNDDIQGTAAVAVAGLFGALRIRDPSRADLREQLKKETFLFHGAGSASIGIMRLLKDEAGVPASSIFATNSRGLIWCSEDGSEGNFRNDEQKEFGCRGKPSCDTTSLEALVEHLKPSCLVGAVGVAPNCFTKPIIEALVRLNLARPVVFALSNPKTQAEITADDAYTWSDGKAIYGSGTAFAPVTLEGGRTLSPGQVNNVYIFPGVSFGAICCQARSIPERFFYAAAEAVANSLDPKDLELDQVLPNRDRIAEVNLNVAAAVALSAQEMALAGKTLGASFEEVRAALAEMRWAPQVQGRSP